VNDKPAPRSALPECHDDVCVTCSDTAVPVTVVRLLANGLAMVDAAVGDVVLVHAKEAIAVVPG
jgi:hydrogenase expression/formation protein HypC